MHRSWLSSNLSSADTLRNTYADGSTMTTSRIPPPITQSILRPPPSQIAGRAQNQQQKQQPWYLRKQRAFEADLQLLLDAQAEGLTRGFDATPPTPSVDSANDRSSLDSSTLTIQNGAFTRRRDGNISLRAARKGLYTTIRRLALLKSEEGAEVALIADDTAAAYAQLKAWTAREERLKARLADIGGGKVAAAARDLREKAADIQPMIDEYEEKLARLKSEQKRLRREADETESRVQAKLSLHSRNLEVLQQDVADFLREMRPLDSDNLAHEPDPFWSLTTKRRTLGLAVELLAKEKEQIDSRAERIENEREALEEGAVVWKDLVKDVEHFERDLKDAMRRTAEDGKGIQLVDLVHWTSKTIKLLESKLKLAETRGWTLLIAAIGAELDAFQKGQALLQQASVDPKSDAPSGTDDDPQPSSIVHPETGAALEEDHAARHKMDELESAFRSKNSMHSSHTDDEHDEDDDDDGPDPELLISHQDTDTD